MWHVLDVSGLNRRNAVRCTRFAIGNDIFFLDTYSSSAKDVSTTLKVQYRGRLVGGSARQRRSYFSAIEADSAEPNSFYTQLTQPQQYVATIAMHQVPG